MRTYFLAAAIGFSAFGSAAAADAFTTKGVDVSAYGGPLYEPRYCDPSGHLPMSTCLLANMTMAEDFLLRAIERKYGLEKYPEQRRTLQAASKRKCDAVRNAAVKQYKSGELIDFTEWSCLRQEYHNTALELAR